MDACDIAAKHEQFLQDRAIENARRGQDLPARAECMDCGEPIPKARQRAVPGCRRCVVCQETFEREP